MIRRYRIPLFILVLSLLVGGAPLGLALGAGVVASHYGCALHEGYSNPCIVFGADRGELLYGLFISGWLSLITLPLGAVGCLLALVWGVLQAVWEWRKRKGSQATD